MTKQLINEISVSNAKYGIRWELMTEQTER